MTTTHKAITALEPAELPAGQRARRDRIVDAALELLADREYEAVQMRDVAEHAGVALGTLYRYFSSKEHLYAAVLLKWASGFGTRRAATAASTPQHELRTLMRRAVRAFEREPQLLRAQMVIERSTDPNARALYDEFGGRISARLADALPTLDRATAEGVLLTVNCVMVNSLRSWAHGRSTIREVERAIEHAIDLIFGPPPG